MSGFRGVRKGLFIQGVWHCDCNPRLPAVHLQTTKPGPNHGRWFRTCNKPPKEQCKFFLWDDDAHAWENEVVANTATPLASNRKRTRSISGTLDKSYPVKIEADDDSGEAVIEMDMPSKAAKMTKSSTPATKRRNLPWDGDQSSSMAGYGLQTPQTERKIQGKQLDQRLATAGDSPFPSSAASQHSTHQVATPYSTPYTYFDGTPNPSQSKSVVDQDLVGGVFGLLQESSIRLPDHTEQKLRALLTRHAKRTEGFKRARDVIRLTVKAREAKIAEFTYRISTLEAELEAEKAMVEHLQWEARNQTSDFD